MSFAQTLIQEGLISAAQLVDATALSKRDGVRLDRALVSSGVLDEEVFLKSMSKQLAIPFVDLPRLPRDPEALKAVPSKLVFQKHLFPVSRHNGSITIATSDPFDLYALDEVNLLTGLHVEGVLATSEEIDKAIKASYGLGGNTIEQMVGGASDMQVVMPEGAEGNEDLMQQAQEASVVKLVNEIFIEALNERASDIHIEPYENSLAVRYRIDGVLHHAQVPPTIRRFQNAIISRIKIMSAMNIAEKRLPQDGRIKIQVSARQVDIRVSVIPMLFGEGVVMRILDRSNVMPTLPELGMAQDTFKTFNDLIARPHGIILVTGPTGSGKTTTLYAALAAIVGPDLKCITIEDPVEYNLTGVNQIQVNNKIEMTFAKGLRAILRHDPDVVMIGEIRDHETAEAAIQASLTGHLVLSTLHTNDACSAATRLIDMGIEPFLVTSTLSGAMAQRLVRTICVECKEAFEPDYALLPPELELKHGEKLYRGKGCRRCRNTGFRGRAGVYELMVADEAVCERILARASSHDIVNVARKNGLRLLREDGWEKVRQGLTTIDEVVRSTSAH